MFSDRVFTEAIVLKRVYIYIKSIYITQYSLLSEHSNRCRRKLMGRRSEEKAIYKPRREAGN